MSQNKDGCYTHIHMHRQRDADLFEDFSRDKLPADEIFVPAHHQPINPEDEDDVVPDQHAAFGITKATQKTREAAWKDLGLAELMHRGPGAAAGGGGGGGGSSSSAVAPTAGSAKRAAKKLALRHQGMPR
ncbi:Apc13 domain-containing protein [Gaeumannomyces tritici R3-111a-1]|uniref:Apc13 domain-containing protein n=1 Tax=Gaeumannomyces tritici (strain R3-111a-1) TaxID=644352 RepID=J3NH20_GAET3|nr:Apc13 domain-containing protein [Gaeumannomyces tritici R3-111a-1]EJT80563.1 Apc13 domain-containing protein [Gaeumannomyces tritici R3-111a-1]